MTIRKKTTEEKKFFRLSCKKIFLTYSQCNLELIYILNQLKNKLEKYSIVSYMLSREKHKNNETEEGAQTGPGVHVHVFIETEKKMNITNGEKLNLEKDGNIFKGNYQSVKDKNNTLNYILKDITSKNDENLLFSKDLENRISLIGNYENFDKCILNLVKAGKINEALELYEKEKPDYYCKHHMRLEKSFRDLYIKTLGISSRYDFDSFIVPEYIKEKMEEALKKNKSLVLSGHPGSGKTKFIESYLIDKLRLLPLIINNIDSLRFFKIGLHNSIVFDDCSFDNCNREMKVKLMDSEDGTSFDIKHSSILIPKATQRFVVTNKDLEELLGKDFEDRAITRRLIFVKLDEKENLYLVKKKDDTLLLPEPEENSKPEKQY